MTSRLLPAPKRLALVALENARSFAALVAFGGAMYAMYAMLGEGVELWMELVPVFLVVFAPLVVVGSFRETMAGGAALWLQRPLDPVRFYFARFPEVAFVAVVSAVLFRCAAVAVGLASGWEPEAHPLQPLPRDALTAVAIVAVGFGLSCWWGDRGRLATVAYLAISLAVAFPMMLAETPQGPWLQVLDAALFPSGGLFRETAWFLSGGPGADWRPAAWFLVYVAAWLGVGVVGIRLVAEHRAK